jgi:hypothetical protein
MLFTLLSLLCIHNTSTRTLELQAGTLQSAVLYTSGFCTPIDYLSRNITVSVTFLLIDFFLLLQSILRQQYEGFSALNFAAVSGDVDTVRELLRKGVDMNSVNYDGRSAFAMVMLCALVSTFHVA